MTTGGASSGLNTRLCRGWLSGLAMPWNTNPCRINMPTIWCPPPTSATTFASEPGFSYQDINLDLAYYLVYMPDHTVNEISSRWSSRR